MLAVTVPQTSFLYSHLLRFATVGTNEDEQSPLYTQELTTFFFTRNQKKKENI
jgi:hypothetical protein